MGPARRSHALLTLTLPRLLARRCPGKLRPKLYGIFDPFPEADPFTTVSTEVFTAIGVGVTAQTKPVVTIEPAAGKAAQIPDKDKKWPWGHIHIDDIHPDHQALVRSFDPTALFFESVTMKQFRDPALPINACYQDPRSPAALVAASQRMRGVLSLLEHPAGPLGWSASATGGSMEWAVGQKTPPKRRRLRAARLLWPSGLGPHPARSRPRGPIAASR